MTTGAWPATGSPAASGRSACCAGALLTAVPLAAMLLIGAPAAALAGMFAVGVGVANGVPLMFSAAGRRPDTAAGPGIAAVSSLGSSASSPVRR